MRDEYDFSNAERGRFFRQGPTLAAPVHLDVDVLAFLIASIATGGSCSRCRKSEVRCI